ncbi:hypothetical protein IDH44_15710 [Paenibacillus sp. IB182496]|uniref:Uncharacterized protein n=1 Tax=Paenibacillus sabuli TaxID=2772509 RepID=A0A927GSU2_9BACL|nr:hypothetical protein [Paenibacillus sabuli]MBD2846646.1 hypothetical protein [Paenibacillus sabuli]
MHSFMLLRSGMVTAEGYYVPFEAALPHAVFSVSQSVTSAAVGIAIGEGLLMLDDRIADTMLGRDEHQLILEAFWDSLYPALGELHTPAHELLLVGTCAAETPQPN